MNKALLVLAACVDIRNGKRFQAGEEFLPVPTPDQAHRLYRAGCLPEAAIDFALDAAREAERAADKKAADDRAAAEAQAKAEAEEKAKAEAEAKKSAEKKG